MSSAAEPDSQPNGSVERADGLAAPEERPSDGDGKAAPGQVVVPAQLLEKLPPETREQIESFLAMSTYAGPMPNPIASKITDEHITQLIDLQSKELDHRGTESGRRYEDRDKQRQWLLRLAIVAVAGFLVLVLSLAFAGHSDLVIELVKAAVIFAGGSGAGYGISKLKPDGEG